MACGSDTSIPALHINPITRVPLLEFIRGIDPPFHYRSPKNDFSSSKSKLFFKFIIAMLAEQAVQKYRTKMTTILTGVPKGILSLLWWWM
jgi:hypothetical protein